MSESRSPKNRALHKAFKVRERLGQKKGGIIAPFPPKPKGMHNSTYDRIRYNALQVERDILLEAMASFMRVSVPEVQRRLVEARSDTMNN